MEETTTSRITRIEAPNAYAALYCPFCGHRVLPAAAMEIGSEQEGELSPCPHTLFIATDDGFEYRSPAYDRLRGITGVDNDDIDVGEDNMEEYTDAPILEGAFKFALYAPSPSFLGTYIGFTGEVLEE